MHKVSSCHLSETLINDCHRILVIPVVSSPMRQLCSYFCPTIRPLRHMHRFRGLKRLQVAVRAHQLRRDHLYRPITTPYELEVYDVVSEDLNVLCAAMGHLASTPILPSYPLNVKFSRCTHMHPLCGLFLEKPAFLEKP
jgi:hypothetical protein